MTGLEKYQKSDLAALADLFRERDPRGLEQMIAEDEWVETVVEQADRDEDGAYWTVSFDGGLCTSLKMPAGDGIAVGDTLRFYQPGGSLFGGMRHGFAVNGRVIEWQTPWERYAKRIAMLAQHDRERRERFAQEKIDIDRWYAILRGPFKARIDRFRAEREDFDINGGSYEVYPVLMAQRITDAVECEPDDESVLAGLRAFRDLPYPEQEKVIHAGEPAKYGISGHQFDSACAMARAVLTGATV